MIEAHPVKEPDNEGACQACPARTDIISLNLCRTGRVVYNVRLCRACCKTTEAALRSARNGNARSYPTERPPAIKKSSTETS